MKGIGQGIFIRILSGPSKRRSGLVLPLLLISSLFLVACEKGKKIENESLTPSPLGGIQVNILTYEADKIKVGIIGTLNREDLPTEAQISFFSSENCQPEPVATLRLADFQTNGAQLVLPLQTRVSIYGETNPTTGCFLVASFTPAIQDPLPPVVTHSEPLFPSRLTTQPVLFGSASPPKSTVKFFKDADCTQLVGQGIASDFSFSGIRINIDSGLNNAIYAQTVDPLNKQSTCSLVGEFQHTSGVVPVPVLSEVLPTSPGATTTPRLKGSLSGSAETLKFFSDVDCSVEIGSGSKETFESTGALITVEENKKTSIYAEAYDADFHSSTCVYLTSYVHDGIKPAVPSFFSITPTGPTNLTYNPKVKGTAPADATFVRFYDSDKCDNMIGVGRKENFGSSGINVTVAKNTLTKIHAQTVDAVGNLSDCTYLVDFEHDSIAPENPIFSITDPISPNNKSVTPLIIGGTDDETISVEIYNDETCTSLLAQGTKEEFTTTGIRVTVPDNQPTSILGVTIDQAGNRSDCTFLITYDHSTRPAPEASFTNTSPPSPTNRTTRPLIIGSVPISVQKVTIYSDSTCQNSLATGSRLSFITTGLQVSIPANALSPLYAMTLDKYGNESGCSFLTNFIHTDRDPLDPIFVSINPGTPNRFSTSPKLKGMIQPLPGGLIAATKVSVYESIACASRLGNGTVAEFEGDGITVNVPANTLSTLYVKAFDDAGNASPCTFMTDYIHDDYKPADPIFESSTPASPSYTQEMMLRGTLGMSQDFLPIASIDFYSDNTCTSKIGSGSDSDFVNSGIKVTALRNTTTTIYAQSTNIVGSQSPCRFMQNFLHNDLGPENLIAQLDSAGAVNLIWKADSVARPVPTYVVKRSLVSGGPYTVLNPNFAGTSYQDLSVNQDQTYYYVVSAKNSTGETLNSTETSITIAAPPPEAANMLMAVGRNREIRLNWSGSATNLNYTVFRSTAQGGPYSLLAKNINSTSYLDKNVTNDQVYFYVVRGLNPSGETVESNEASAIPRAVPSPPTGLRYSAIPWLSSCNSAAVVLHWDPPTYHDGFTIHRSRTAGVTSPLGTSSSNSYIDCITNGEMTSGLETTYYSVSTIWGSVQSANSSSVLFYRILPVTLTVTPGNQTNSLNWDFNNYGNSADVYRATSPRGPFTLIASGLTGPTYNDTAVTNGVAYYYYVQNYLDGDLYGFASYTQSGTPSADPSAPTNLTIASDANLPVLSWTPPTHATSYYVYRANSAAGPYGYLATTATSNYKDTTITTGLRFYRVTASWGSYETAPTNTVSFRYGHPSSLTATPGSTSISLSWPSVASATGYSIMRSTSAGGTYTQIGTSTTTSYTDSSAASGVGYYYVVRASFSDSTVGGFSPEASAMRTGVNVPSGITVTATTTSTISLEWVKVNSATRYTIYRATDVGGPYQNIATTASTTYQVGGLLSNRDYFFKLTATVGGSESAQSAAVSARTVAQPTTVPTGQPGNNQIRVTWNPLIGANTYALERSTDRSTFATVASGLTTTTFTDTTAVNGTRYFYRLVVNYNFGSVRSKVSDGITPGIVPLVPAGLEITSNWSGTDIQVSWSPVALATSYKVYSSANAGGPWTELGQTSNSYYDASGLTADTPIYFAVAALNGLMESALSSSIGAVPSAFPAAPSVEAASNTSVIVTWNSVSFASSYDLHRSTDGVNFSLLVGGLATTTYTDNSVVGTETYYYRFTPRHTSGLLGATSSTSSAVTTGVTPLIPSNLKASALSSTSIRITWVGVPNVTSYAVSRSTSQGGPYTVLGTVNDPDASFDDTTVAPGTVYYYVVQSVNEFKKKSGYSSEVGIRTDEAPTNLTVSVSNHKNALSWDSVPGAVGYRVFRATFSGGPYGVLTSSINATTFDDTEISDGAVYFYVVSAVFANQQISSFSNEVSATSIRTADIATAIELLDLGIYSQDTQTVWHRSAVNIKPSAYNGTISSEFEIHAANLDSDPKFVELINGSNVVLAQISIPAGTANITRFSAPMTWPASADVLKIRTDGTTGLGMVQITNSRVIIKQVGASKTRLYVPLLSRAVTPTSDNFYQANLLTTTSTTYQGLNMALPFKREFSALSKLASLNPFVLEVIPSAAMNSKGAFGLVNKSNSTLIQTTETLFDGGENAPILVPFSDNLTAFDSVNEGDLFEIDLRCRIGCTGDGWVGLQKAGLWIELDRLEKAISYVRVSPTGESLMSDTASTDARTRIDLGDYSNPTISIQAKGTNSGLNPSMVQLVSLGSADSDPSTPVAVTDSDLIFSVSAPTLVRSLPLTLSSGERFGASFRPGLNSTLSTSSVMILINISD